MGGTRIGQESRVLCGLCNAGASCMSAYRTNTFFWMSFTTHRNGIALAEPKIWTNYVGENKDRHAIWQQRRAKRGRTGCLHEDFPRTHL